MRKQNSKIIDIFSNQYSREYDFYSAASLSAAQIIETQLINRGIRAIVTSRAKNPSRLHDKLLQRSSEESKNYDTLDDIYKDIVDLSGVRVALYFNSERDEIEQILNEIFDVHKIKEFPAKGMSQGYKATHYRGRIKSIVLSEQQQRYSKANIEIQVASLLMHAWAEVEHDIVYKPLQGTVSNTEMEALNELNSLVLEGEKTLRKLQQATYKRNKFNDHYDLYNFLIEFISVKYNDEVGWTYIGDTKNLYSYLFSNNIDTQNKLKNRIGDLKIILDENWTLSDQIMDFIEGNYNTKKKSYLKSTSNIAKSSNMSDSSIGRFLLAWIKLEKMLKGNDSKTFDKNTYIRLNSFVKMNNISEDEHNKIHKLRTIRNNLVHGFEIPDEDYLKTYTDQLEKLTNSLTFK